MQTSRSPLAAHRWLADRLHCRAKILVWVRERALWEALLCASVWKTNTKSTTIPHSVFDDNGGRKKYENLCGVVGARQRQALTSVCKVLK